MTAQPGRPQPAFTAGEIATSLIERKDLKYYRAGASYMRNVEILPQGGFRLAPGLRRLAIVHSQASRIRSFTSADGTRSEHVWSPGEGRVYEGENHVATYAHPYGTDALLKMKSVQQLDTLLAFHQDAPPWRVLRQGSNAAWDSNPAPLVNIPLHDYGGPIGGGSYSNGVTEKWEIRFVGEPNNATSDEFHYVATLNGVETNSMSFVEVAAAPDYAAFCATIKAALEALPEIEAGLTVTLSVPAGQPIYTVEFSGTGNQGTGYALSFRCTDKSDIACPCYRTRKGVAPGEPIFSADRGYPRCGVLYQQRLILGGLKSRPNVWMPSTEGNYFDFQTDTAAASGAMVVPMDTEGGEAIEELVAGRTLLLLTSAAEYFIADRAISKTTAPNHVETSRHGIASGIRAVENEGSAIFASMNGNVLYEFSYDDVAQTYVTRNLSILATHLVNDVRDQALVRSSVDNDCNREHVVRGDGTITTFHLLREQNITAAARRHTTGFFVAISANSANEGLVINDVGGVRYLERFQPNLVIDSARSVIISPASRTLTGLGEFEGQTVYVLAEGDDAGDVLGPFTVTGGQIADLGQVCSSVTVGTWIAPRVETMPLSREIGPGVVLERRGRIHTVRLSLYETTSVAVGANGGRIYNIPLFRFGQEMGGRTLANRFTGVVTIRGLTGYSDQPSVVITQKHPGRLHVRGLTVEADL